MIILTWLIVLVFGDRLGYWNRPYCVVVLVVDLVYLPVPIFVHGSVSERSIRDGVRHAFLVVHQILSRVGVLSFYFDDRVDHLADVHTKLLHFCYLISVSIPLDIKLGKRLARLCLFGLHWPIVA